MVSLFKRSDDGVVGLALSGTAAVNQTRLCQALALPGSSDYYHLQQARQNHCEPEYLNALAQAIQEVKPSPPDYERQAEGNFSQQIVRRSIGSNR